MAKNKLDILKVMTLIRLAEQYIALRYPEQKMRCPTHLCLGQEATPAVFGAFAHKEDIFVGTYRSHGHYLAKGGNLFKLFAEILGSEEGGSNGYGGSMHIMDETVNFYGTSAIVGGGVPIATGAAYAFKYRKEPNVVFCFFGDGAVEEGAVYESVNFAVLHNLPIIFVCENNRFAVTTPIELRTKQLTRFKHFTGIDLPGFHVEDTDVDNLIKVAKTSCDNAREGHGPSFIEVRVDRWALHVGHDYKGPVDYWFTEPKSEKAKNCPIARLASYLIDKKEITISNLKALRDEQWSYIDKEFKKAEAVPLASNSLFEEMVYASGVLSSLPNSKSIKENFYKHKEQEKLVNPF